MRQSASLPLNTELSKSSELNELRNRRDAYLEKAVMAMATTFKEMSTEGWRKWVYDYRDKPGIMVDGLNVLLPDIHNFHSWAMITRYAWLCALTRAEEFRRLQFKRHMIALSR